MEFNVCFQTSIGNTYGCNLPPLPRGSVRVVRRPALRAVRQGSQPTWTPEAAGPTSVVQFLARLSFPSCVPALYSPLAVLD